MCVFLVPARIVWAAVGKSAELPCDLTPPTPQDSVKLLLWFKDTTGIPLYRQVQYFYLMASGLIIEFNFGCVCCGG